MRSSLARRVVDAISNDWRAVDDPVYYLVASIILAVGAALLIVGGGNPLIGVLLLPVAVSPPTEQFRR